MKRIYSLLAALLVVGLCLGLFTSCSKSEPLPTPAGIKYDIGQGAEMSKVTWYLTDGYLWFDIAIKNTSGAEKLFWVSVNVDDEPLFVGENGGVKLKVNETVTYKIQTTLKSAQPKQISIGVTPK